jgi:hypothetical protein
LEEIWDTCKKIRRDVLKILHRTNEPNSSNETVKQTGYLEHAPENLPICSLEELQDLAKQAVWWAEQTFKAVDKKDHLKLLAVLDEFFSSDFLKLCNVINFKGTMNIFKRPITKLVFSSKYNFIDRYYKQIIINFILFFQSLESSIYSTLCSMVVLYDGTGSVLKRTTVPR